jgi:CheY-like chemotaxis protein
MFLQRACTHALSPCPDLHRAADGRSALEFLARCLDLPRLIISDLKMPQVDGLELLQQVRENPDWNHIRFVMFSNSNAPKDKERALELGVDDYRVKPSRVEDLRRIVLEISKG